MRKVDYTNDLYVVQKYSYLTDGFEIVRSQRLVLGVEYLNDIS